MAEFLKAQPFILKWEGGYVNDPDDRGGETYRGITRKNFPQWPGWELVDNHKPLKRGELVGSGILDNMVSEFYKVHFWDNIKGDGIAHQGVATYLYDFYVNAGRNAVKVLQRVLGVGDDGILGPGTLAAVNESGAGVLDELHKGREMYYKRIGVGSNEQFLKGWLNRAEYVYEHCRG